MGPLMLLSCAEIGRTGFLSYCGDDLREFLAGSRRMLFVPFARPDYDNYTEKVRMALGGILPITGAHTLPASHALDLSEFDAIFCGGGNTFLLLKTLYDKSFMAPIRQVVERGAKFIGTSAGVIVACPTIGTTNDMPIVFPPSFKALNLVPFNISPHYYEVENVEAHPGKTKRRRIREFIYSNHRPVIGLEEGAIIVARDGEATLRGTAGAQVFLPGPEIVEYKVAPGGSLSFLLADRPSFGDQSPLVSPYPDSNA